MTLRPPTPKALARTIANHDEQLRRLRTQAPFSWDNFRFEGGKAISTNGGAGRVDFSVPFDTVCWMVVCQQHTPGDVPQLALGAQWFDPKGFTLTIESNFTGSFEINYIALGA